MHLSGMTCQPLTADRLLVWLTSFMPESRASHGASLANTAEQPTSDGYGATSSESSLRSNQGTSFLKKCLGLFTEEVLVSSYPTLPKRGSMRNGTVSRRQKSARRTSANGCSSWPTPVDYDSTPGGPNNHYKGLAQMMQWPTARAEDGESCGGHNAREAADSLRAAVTWPTPDSFMDMNANKKANQENRNGNNTVLSAATAQWPTPNVPNRGCESQASKDNRPDSGGIDLQTAVLWPTPNAPNGGRTSNTSNYREDGSKRQAELAAVVISGPQAPDSHSTSGKSQELWQTPHAAVGGHISRGGDRKNEPYLPGQVKQYAKGRLNPLWVSQLMGVAVGWCDPEWTNSDCSATASFRHRRKEPSGNL